jgi:hypothetical protein
MNISQNVLSESIQGATRASGKVGMLRSDCVTHSETRIQESSRRQMARSSASSFFSGPLVMKQ